MSQSLGKCLGLGRACAASAASSTRRVVPLKYRLLGAGLNLVSLVRKQWAAEFVGNLWFTVFKSRRKPWVQAFWQSADKCVNVTVGEHSIPVYLWGTGPLAVCLHGWSGSGTQFRRFIPALLKSGYQVALFDVPAHGINPGKQSHLLHFSDSLFAIQQQIGHIDSLVAHSFGGMASVLATHYGLTPRQIVLLGPHLDVQKMFESYRDVLNLRSDLSIEFHHNIGQRMAEILEVDNVWEFLSPEKLLENRDFRGLLVFDRDDEEIPQSQFEAVKCHWQDCETLQTSGLGHQRILKDEEVIERVADFMRPV